MSSNPIGVYNEWGKLKEVIVGIMTDDAVVPPPSYTIFKYLSPQKQEAFEEYQGKVMKDVIPDQHKGTVEQVNAVAKVYENHGIKVHRAKPLNEDEQQYLSWSQAGWSPLYARDQTLVAGKTVMELYSMMPMRRRDVFAFRDILLKRVAEDPEAQLISMPQPVPTKVYKDQPEGPGPFLEGGDIFVMGKDILVGHSGVATNGMGIEWLRRLMALDGYRVHEVLLTPEWLHLDCIFAVVRPGLAIIDKTGLKNGLNSFPEFMRKWEFIEGTSDEAHAMGTNTMCLEENKVLIGSEHGRLIDELKKHGANVVSTNTETLSKWGGGIRCSTHPLLRDE